MGYAYSPGKANPDAVTQIANGFSTTTFTYDANGNVTQKIVDGTTFTYVGIMQIV
jgi:YD repeat-containing protein